MANIKSAKKRINVIAKKTLQNKIIKSQVKSATKKLVTAVDSNDTNLAKEELTNVISTIDKAAKKGVFHKKNASRKISRLSKMVNKINE